MASALKCGEPSAAGSRGPQPHAAEFRGNGVANRYREAEDGETSARFGTRCREPKLLRRTYPQSAPEGPAAVLRCPCLCPPEGPASSPISARMSATDRDGVRTMAFEDRVPMTREGYERLKADLDRMNNVEMIEVARRIASARELGDLSENAEYHAAREDQGILQARV